MPELAAENPMSRESAGAGGGPGWRRRRYVVDARHQLRAGVLVGAAALGLIVLLNFSLMSGRGTAGALTGRLARPETAGDGGASVVLVLFGSLAFVAGVVLVTLVESHRTAGAAFAIRRAVDEIRNGRTDIRVRLRRRDHLQDLARSINRLAEVIDSERIGRR